MEHPVLTEHTPDEPQKGFFAWWHHTPLYWRILVALLLGGIAGALLGPNAHYLEIPSMLVLRMLGALAPPLILIAVVQALLKANIKGNMAARMVRLLVLNTLVAILIGLFVANVVRPGAWTARLAIPKIPGKEAGNLFTQFLENVPKSLLGPLSDNGSIIGVIFIAVSFGVALRRSKDTPVHTVSDLVDIAFDSLITVLHWVIDLVPIGVFGIVAGKVGTQGFAPFVGLIYFVGAVILALLLQLGYYLLRVRMLSWVRPVPLIKGMRDAILMAFSTDSSTVTMPVTYSCLREKVGLREESARMGALVGSNFNNDGTALYEAMSALFISQMIGQNLGLGEQVLVILTSIVASVGAAGIPEAGIVTMTLVFTAVKLPTEYIPLLLTVDWFLDRCRTVINMMGDTNVSCILDGKIPETPPALEPHKEVV